MPVVILLFICLPPLSTLWSQDPYYVNYTVEDGLPSNEVYDIEVDDSGLIWFTTDRGICYYDGYGFKTFTTDDGLANNTNFEIYRDSLGRYWFNGIDAGFTIYEEGKFRGLEYNQQLEKMGLGRWIVSIIWHDDKLIFTKIKHPERYYQLDFKTGGLTTFELNTPERIYHNDKWGEFFQLNFGEDRMLRNDKLAFNTEVIGIGDSSFLALFDKHLLLFSGDQAVEISATSHQPYTHRTPIENPSNTH